MTVPPARYDPVGDMERTQREYKMKDHLDKLTGSGRHAGGPTDGPHFTMANVMAGLGVAFVMWWAVQLVGLNPLWSIPCGVIAVPLSGAKRRRSRSQERSTKRAKKPVWFFMLLGAAACTAMGVWFAVSEGDIPIVRAALTSGVIGAVLGFVFGLVVRVWRAMVKPRPA
jgi:hypothetical protein